MATKYQRMNWFHSHRECIGSWLECNSFSQVVNAVFDFSYSQEKQTKRVQSTHSQW